MSAYGKRGQTATFWRAAWTIAHACARDLGVKTSKVKLPLLVVTCFAIMTEQCWYLYDPVVWVGAERVSLLAENALLGLEEFLRAGVLEKAPLLKILEKISQMSTMCVAPRGPWRCREAPRSHLAENSRGFPCTLAATASNSSHARQLPPQV
jgi:hypothetical protein